MSPLLASALLLLPSTQAAASELEVDELVEKHLEARGGREALRAIRTLVFDDGRYHEEGVALGGGAYMAFKRPFLRVVGHPDRPAGFREGYDGSTWEWYADPGVVLRTVGPASRAIRHGAVLDGPFLDYRERGTSLVLHPGTVAIAGRPTLCVGVTLRDGTTGESFFDAETFLLVATRSAAPIHAFGPAVETESRFEDFRRVAGVLFPHRDLTVRIATGEVQSEMRWGKIEANVELPDAMFRPPAFERTRVQTFVEQLFAQRDDPSAVLWTCHDYRRAFPGLDLRRGVEFAGYHMLKMQSYPAAIALLEEHARAHPRRARAAFELGRSYEASGRVDDALRQYEQALITQADFAPAAAALADLEAR